MLAKTLQCPMKLWKIQVLEYLPLKTYCVENFFHLVRKAIVEDTKNKNITKETFEEFQQESKISFLNLFEKS